MRARIPLVKQFNIPPEMRCKSSPRSGPRSQARPPFVGNAIHWHCNRPWKCLCSLTARLHRQPSKRPILYNRILEILVKCPKFTAFSTEVRRSWIWMGDHDRGFFRCLFKHSTLFAKLALASFQKKKKKIRHGHGTGVGNARSARASL